MIYTVTLTPAVDKTVVLPGFTIGKVNRIEALRLDAGGKGINVSKTIRALGGESVACGIIGGSTGKFIRESLEAEGIASDFVTVSADTRTNLKVIDPVNHTNTDINEPGAAVGSDVLEEVAVRLEARLIPGDAVVLAGKAPSGTRATIFREWTERFHRCGAKVYLDADGALMAEGIEACPDMIKPNDEELAGITGEKFGSISDIAACAARMVAQGISTVVVSLGSEGAIFATKAGIIRGYGLKVPVQSTVGAGDATMAAVCYGEMQGKTQREVAAMAIAAGAAAVTQSGTQAISCQMVEELQKQVVLE